MSSATVTFRNAQARGSIRHVTTQGERIKALAAKHDTTIVALAKTASIDEKALINISNDKIGLGTIRAQRIADALDEPLSEVLLPKAKADTLASVSHRLRLVEARQEKSRQWIETLALASLPDLLPEIQASLSAPMDRPAEA